MKRAEADLAAVHRARCGRSSTRCRPRATRRCRASPASSTRPTFRRTASSSPRPSSTRPSSALEPEVSEAIEFARRQHPQLPRGAEARADVAQGDPPRRLCRRPLAPDPVGRPLRAARQGLVPVGDDDDHGAGGGRRRAGDRHLHAAGARRHGRRRRRWSRRASPASRRSTRCGGAQAVAAAAYGTETVRKAVKIVGPGSPWVVAAKRLLADVDRHRPAGRAVGGDRPRRRHASTAARRRSTC